MLKGQGVGDMALVLQQSGLRWCGRVLRRDDEDWVKKCMEHEVGGSGPRGGPERTWREVVRGDCRARGLDEEDAVDRCGWRGMVGEAR